MQHFIKFSGEVTDVHMVQSDLRFFKRHMLVAELWKSQASCYLIILVFTLSSAVSLLQASFLNI